jgi:hypothetical protein
MTERILSELQKEYRHFFLGKLKLYGVKSPAELKSKENKSKFFTEIKQDWAKIKLDKRQRKQSHKKLNLTTTSKKEIGSIPTIKRITAEPDTKNLKKPTHQNAESKNYEKIQEQQQPTQQKFSKQIIKSEPNKEQTDDLKILFTPNNHFEQSEQYLYPVVKMPKHNSNLKLPRLGRSNQKGYKENDFYNQIKSKITSIDVENNVHMVIPYYNKPYEPDIVLFDKKLNLYIDIEIDEPYDGYYRYPTHYTNPEDEIKQDNVRDLFFIESGWIVIRFSERQVHCEANECIDYIQNVLNSIYNRNFTTDVKSEREKQWDYNQCIQWQKNYYRERYLGIERFNKQYTYKEIEINTEEKENIEKEIQRTKLFKVSNWTTSLGFDEQAHKYIKDETGNAEYISVTTLIERFFPFDLKRYIEKKAEEEDRTEEDVLIEYLMIRDEAAEKGTFLHNQIEKFLKGNKFDSDSKEFVQFLNFYATEIKKRNITFFDAEKMIFSDKYNVAGTIDCLFKKNDTNQYIMLDWKRSKKLIIDGRPRIFGFGYALSELSNLDNSSYYRYCLQQNIYKQIVECEYSIKISSMKLIVLHENYPDYYVVNVPEMKRESKIILNSIKHKI